MFLSGLIEVTDDLVSVESEDRNSVHSEGMGTVAAAASTSRQTATSVWVDGCCCQSTPEPISLVSGCYY